MYSKTCLTCKRPLKTKMKTGFKIAYRLMQVKSIAESAILLPFIKLTFVIKIFVLSILARIHYFYVLAHLCPMEFPDLIDWSNSF